jgi:uncharacterized coiled-coil protein SlyX
MNLEEKIQELEFQNAYLQNTVNTLDEVVIAMGTQNDLQEKRIYRLEKQILQVVDHQKAIVNETPSNGMNR